ncbi:MAG: argininosuccinate lyase [Thermodesulfobacteriota bacterium]|nr:argininosuccinate lyase [Thermodesulfobacteriota bacterium]
MADNKKMWGARFAAKTASLVEEYAASVGFDQKLYAEDIQGSLAHARMLAKQGIISREDAARIEDGLKKIQKKIEDGTFEWRQDLEDVHTNIEARLTEMIGPAGAKLHTGRSRNDQVALDFRLYTAKRLAQWQDLLKDLIQVLADRAKEQKDTLLPGMTHLQPAQPISLAHHLLAYVQMFRRDFERVRDCLKRVRVSPLGAAALAGTTYPLDPKETAKDLGFPKIFKNSMDAVSDRDFVIEAVFTGSVVMAHLSRLCTEIILWANPHFGYVTLPDAFATGSSIMPQKKNPDPAELMRGKTGRVYGDLTALLTIIKGLPLTYNRDLQEDKEPFFDADETVRSSLEIMAGMLEQITFNPELMRKALGLGFINATELADYLAAKGLPFRDAHAIAGQAVSYAERQGKGLEDLSLEKLREFSSLVERDVFKVLSHKSAAARRETPGGTGPRAIREQLSAIQKWLKTKPSS